MHRSCCPRRRRAKTRGWAAALPPTTVEDFQGRAKEAAGSAHDKLGADKSGNCARLPSANPAAVPGSQVRIMPGARKVRSGTPSGPFLGAVGPLGPFWRPLGPSWGPF
eukprot:8603216-Pyramimonas_sp.AAC.1